MNIKNNKNLIQWLINIHNEVNVLNNKRKYTYDEVYNMYESIYKKNNNNLLFIIAIVIIIIVLVIIVMKYLKKKFKFNYFYYIKFIPFIPFIIH